jgi:hypothetical protein
MIDDISYDNFLKKPTIVDGTIQENCKFKITMMGDTMIIDKEYIDEIMSIINNNEIPKDLLNLLGFIQNVINEYFYSENGYDNSREHFYLKNVEVDENGECIGTKLSLLKGKNIAECSEKSVTAYIILDKLYRDGKIMRKPSLVVSSLSTEKIPSGPHSFVILDGKGEYPTKYLLYDPQNKTMIEDKDGNKGYNIGVYCLTDEQRENIENGIKCTPESIYSALNMPYTIISDKLTYGSLEKEKTL